MLCNYKAADKLNTGLDHSECKWTKYLELHTKNPDRSLRPVQHKWLGSQFIDYITVYFGCKIRLMTAPRSNLLTQTVSNRCLMSALLTKAMKNLNLIFNTNKATALFSTSSGRFSAWLSSMGDIRVPATPRCPDEVCSAHLFFADCMMKLHAHTQPVEVWIGVWGVDDEPMLLSLSEHQGAGRGITCTIWKWHIWAWGWQASGVTWQPVVWLNLLSCESWIGSAVKTLGAVWAVWMRFCVCSELIIMKWSGASLRWQS